MSKIHPSAIIEDGAKIGDDCIIGAFCHIASSSVIGNNCHLQSHVVIGEHTTIGSNCKIFPFAAVGTQSQDLKYIPNEISFAKIGNDCIIREYVTIHRGTEKNSITAIGNNCALLALSHVGHNCILQDNIILSHNASLGGHVQIASNANIGGLSAVHQFCKIGKNAMVAGMARVIQDILPYTIAEGTPANMRIINKIGMQRSNYSAEEIKEATTCFKILFKQNLTLEHAIDKIKQSCTTQVSKNIITFIEQSDRGLARK